MFKGNWSALSEKVRAADRMRRQPAVLQMSGQPGVCNIKSLVQLEAKLKKDEKKSAARPSNLVEVEPPSGPSGVRSVKTKNSKEGFGSLKPDSKKKLSVYLEDAVRDSTKKTYSSYWIRYKKFCKEEDLSIRAPESIGLYLINLAERTGSKSGALTAKHSIKYFLKITYPFKKAATDNYFVSRISKSITKKFGKPVKKAKRIPSQLVKKMVLKLLSSGSFKDERTAVFILMQFCFFARYEEIARLEKSHVKISEGHLEVYFPSAKNYDKWDAKKSWIASNDGGAIDPVKIVKLYIAKLPENQTWLFANFRLQGKFKKISFIDKPLSYGNCLKLLREALDSIGEAGKSFSLHGLRTGSLSEAANSSRKVCRDSLKRHGRWKAVEMVDSYHELSMENKLGPSKTLGIYD